MQPISTWPRAIAQSTASAPVFPEMHSKRTLAAKIFTNGLPEGTSKQTQQQEADIIKGYPCTLPPNVQAKRPLLAITFQVDYELFCWLS